MSRAKLLSPSEIAVAIAAEPLISVKAASELLGIPNSNFKRDAAPHLTELPMEGSATKAYFRSEVEELARKRAEARAARAGNGVKAAA